MDCQLLGYTTPEACAKVTDELLADYVSSRTLSNCVVSLEHCSSISNSGLDMLVSDLRDLCSNSMTPSLSGFYMSWVNRVEFTAM
jgi:hypothetical protein